MGALPRSVGACRAGGRLGLSPARPSLDSLTGAGGVGVVAPIALGFAVQHQISPLLMGLMVIHGAQAGGFSPISIYNLAVAVLLFMVLGGRDLLRRRVEVTEAPGDDSSRASEAGTGESQPPSEAAPRVLATSPSGPRRPTATPR